MNKNKSAENGNIAGPRSGTDSANRRWTSPFRSRGPRPACGVVQRLRRPLSQLLLPPLRGFDQAALSRGTTRPGVPDVTVSRH